MTAVDTRTGLFGVFGNPVSHSMSPAMFNRAFTETGINGVYLAFKVENLRRAIDGVRALGLRGISITIPHKTAVIPLLDELEPMAEKIGAVNTISNRKGILIGSNTDCAGAVNALKTAVVLDGLQVAVIGAGGAARAIAFGLVSEGAHVTLVNRSRDNGERLARELDIDFEPLDRFSGRHFQTLVNTTPVGMTPGTDACPVPETTLHPEMVVMDIVYNPIRTRLLEAAVARGCRIIDGVSMFVRQGALQFEAWTGVPAPMSAMAETVRSLLEPP